ncbi:MAG TPA: hypothetical protein VF275_13180 [Gammaproteobacteria bacterium]
MRLRLTIRVTGLALLLLPAFAFAGTPVVIEGSASYSASGSQVTISVDRVTNTSSDTTSGTLYLTLWATSGSSPFDTGHELASVQLGELAPGEYFYDIVQTASFTPPPNGTFYIHLLVVEYPDFDTVLDHVTFGTETFGSTGGSGGGGGDSGGGDTGGGDTGSGGNGDLNIVGDALPVYDMEGYIALIAFEGEMVGSDMISIINEGTTTSGALRARVVASNERYTGGTLTGYTLADYDLPEALGPGEWYADFQAPVTPADTHPSFGEYYVYTLLMERGTDGQYYIVDYREWSGLQTVGCGPTVDCVVGEDPAEEEGGGGPLQPFLLLMLAGFGAGARFMRIRSRQ